MLYQRRMRNTKSITLFLLTTSVLLLAFAGAAHAADCSGWQSYLDQANGMDIHQLAPADSIVGTNTVVKLNVSGTILYAEVTDGNISIDNSTNRTPEYLATTTACTLTQMQDGNITGIKAYNDGEITVHGLSLSSSIKVFFAGVLAHVFGWFA